jgi:cell division protein FtsQ
MKKKLPIIVVSLFAALMLVLAGYIYNRFRNQNLKKVEIRIEQKNGRGFLTQQEVLALFDRGDSLSRVKVKNLNLKKIKYEISKNPYVENADAFLNISGNLIVNVKEKVALLRVTNYKGKSCYIDLKGILFPLGEDYAERAIFVNGYIHAPLVMGKSVQDSSYSKTMLPGLYDLAMKIHSNRFLNSEISQIFVNSQGNVDLIPELGNFIIHFGNLEEKEIKLENLEALYKQALVQEGWNKYKSINLAFTNQVICTKK